MSIYASPQEQDQAERFVVQLRRLPEDHQNFVGRYIMAMLRIQAAENEEFRQLAEKELIDLAVESQERFGADIDLNESLSRH